MLPQPLRPSSCDHSKCRKKIHYVRHTASPTLHAWPCTALRRPASCSSEIGCRPSESSAVFIPAELALCADIFTPKFWNNHDDLTHGTRQKRRACGPQTHRGAAMPGLGHFIASGAVGRRVRGAKDSLCFRNVHARQRTGGRSASTSASSIHATPILPVALEPKVGGGRTYRWTLTVPRHRPPPVTV